MLRSGGGEASDCIYLSVFEEKYNFLYICIVAFKVLNTNRFWHIQIQTALSSQDVPFNITC